VKRKGPLRLLKALIERLVESENGGSDLIQGE
jgi:hypothetical protein